MAGHHPANIQRHCMFQMDFSCKIMMQIRNSQSGVKMERRTFLKGSAAALAAAAIAPKAIADELPLGPLPGTRYPDPRVEALDARFKYKIGNAYIERVATGCRWCEGPVYFRDGGYLVWSDIPNNRMM